MAITWEDVGSDEDLAREVLIVARDIAPCLDSLEGEPKKDALAVLRRVYKETVGRGLLGVKSQRIGSAAVEYRDVESAFAGQPSRALRSLCSASASAGAHSLGSFPPGGVVPRVWPEGC